MQSIYASIHDDEPYWTDVLPSVSNEGLHSIVADIDAPKRPLEPVELSTTDILELLFLSSKYDKRNELVNVCDYIISYLDHGFTQGATDQEETEEMESMDYLLKILCDDSSPISTPTKYALQAFLKSRLYDEEYQNLVELLLWALPELRNAAKCIRPAPVHKSGFLYIVCDEYDTSTADSPSHGKPALFVIGHTDRSGVIKHWGVPGGLKDDTDPSFEWGAMREFGEEVIGSTNPNVKLIFKRFKEFWTSFSWLVKTDHLGAFLIRIPKASDLENAILKPTIFHGKDPDAEFVHTMRLSKETAGIRWVTLDAIRDAIAEGPGMDGRLHPTIDTEGNTAPLRPMTIGMMKRTSEYVVGAAWEGIMKKFPQS